MARPSSRLRMAYFPLPEAEARRIRQHLIYPPFSFTALDPCAGEGKALAVLAEGTQGQRCGIEALGMPEGGRSSSQNAIGALSPRAETLSGKSAPHMPGAEIRAKRRQALIRVNIDWD